MSNKQTKSSNVLGSRSSDPKNLPPLPGFKIPDGLSKDPISEMMVSGLSSYAFNGGSIKGCEEVRKVGRELSAHAVRVKKYGI
jgi:hypothetical protein